ECDVAHRQRLQQVQEEGIGRDFIQAGPDQLVQRQALRPRGGLSADRLPELRQQREKRRADSGILLQQLRHQRERAGVIVRCFFCLALGLKDPAEVVACLRVVGGECQNPFVGANGVVDLPSALVRGGFNEKLPDLVSRIGAWRGVAFGSSAVCPSPSISVTISGRAPRSKISCLTTLGGFYTPSFIRRRGRVAEGGGLLNRYTLQRRIEGSNPSVSAKRKPKPSSESASIV